MRIPESNRFADGWNGYDPATGRLPYATVTGRPSVAGGYLAPHHSGVRVLNGTPGNVPSQADALRIMVATTHDIVMRSSITLTPRDLIGSDIIEVKSPDGVPMMRTATLGSSSGDGKWIATSGAAGPNEHSAFVTNPFASWSGGQAALNIKGAVNFLLFLAVEVPQNANWTNIREVGFDIGGWKHEPTGGQDTSGAFGMSLGNNFFGSGAIDSYTTTTYRAAFANFPAITTNLTYGRIVNVMAVNGTVNAIAVQATNKGATLSVLSGPDIVNNSTATPWTEFGGAGGRKGLISLNLGDGVTEEGFGIYFMGAATYSAAIPLSEVQAVAQFMGKTGLLPPWWR